MRKSFLLIPALALALASCSSDEPLGGNSTQVISDGTTDYLYFAITNPGEGTRAEIGGHDIDNDFQDGTDAESKASSVRFFFFYSSGNAAMVNTVETSGVPAQVSYLDWQAYEEVTPPTGETVEAAYKGLLTLNVPKGLEKPTQVVAIVNPTTDVLGLTNPSLSDLTAVTHNYAPLTDPANTTGALSCAVADKFLMSNSVWVDPNNSNELLHSTAIDPVTQMFDTEEAALANPVIIYVERVAARVDLSIWADQISEEEKSQLGLTGFVFDTGVKVNENPIYVQFLNWGVTSTPTDSYLVKNVNTDWTTQSLFGYGDTNSSRQWTVPSLHRSFWAVDPQQTTNDYSGYNFLSYNDINASLPQNGSSSSTMGSSKITSTLYTQEHASPYDTSNAPERPTDVIITGKLYEIQTVDGQKRADECQLAEWNHVRMAPSAVLEAIAGQLPLYKTGDTSITGEALETYHIKAADLTFETQFDFSSQNAITNPGGYYVYVTLSEQGAKNTWYDRSQLSEGSDSQTYDSYNADGVGATGSVANFIESKNFGDIMVWNAGKTYYYFEIRHLGEEGSVGYYGVVRNHIYDAQVKSIFGLGTPVWDPTEPIVPEKPNGDNNLMSAQINILQWRIVTQGYNLEW